MDWSVSVLTTATSDTEPTIVVRFDTAKYIFNAGENTNRSFLQSKQNWKRTQGLFFTSLGTHRTGGLAGLLMTLADATIPRLHVVGPPGMLHLMNTMRLYTFRETMPVVPIEASFAPSDASPPDPLFKDNNVTIYAVPVLQYLPDVSSSTPSDEGASQKRKRSVSPQSSSKRSAGTPPEGEPRKLHELMADPDFTPAALQGELAQEWRRLVLKTMFPSTKQVKDEELAKHEQYLLRQARKELRAKSGEGSSTDSAKGFKTGDSTKLSNLGGPLDQKRSLSTISPTVESSAIIPLEVPLEDNWNRPNQPRGFNKRLPEFSSPLPALPHDAELTPTMAYVIVGPRIRGKFDIAKAKSLGVPFGPLRGRLTKGQTVTFKVKEGNTMVERTVQPEQCVGESESPGVLLILDVPTPAHIPSVVSSFSTSPFFSRFRSKKPEDIKEFTVRTVFHLCGPGVLDDPRYVSFLSGFDDHTHHLVSSRDYLADPVTFTSAAYTQLRLNQLDPQIFPLPHHSLSPRKDITSIAGLPAKTMLLQANTLVKMRPPEPPAHFTDAAAYDRFHPAVTANAPLELSTLTSQRYSEAKALVQDLKSKIARPQGSDVLILPLGTGSSLPTKYRNVSCTLIQIPGWGNIILDAGEGTWGQLARQFGAGVWQVLRDIKCIFLSHVHGDHHMGVAHILAQRLKLDPPPSEPLYLVAIRSIHLYLHELSNIQDLGLNNLSGNGVRIVMSEALHWRQTGAYQNTKMWHVIEDEPWTAIERSQEHSREMCRALGLRSFLTVDMFHRTRCYGVVIRHHDGWSVAYSADTMPTDSLVNAGSNVTVLIHEATMDDDAVRLAKLKGHSTVGQAVDVGRRMGAEHILLTHFSARYPKMPPSGLSSLVAVDKDSGNGKEPVVALALDHANITIGDMWKMSSYLPAIQQSFEESMEDGDDEEDTYPIEDVDIS